tara:strand:- start:12539 stop:12898 length:360 start_codon:yes stop_codon:yes gene_type:complete
MKNFIVHIEQAAEGCDYTIGCGNSLVKLYAEDITQAHERFISMLSPDFDDDDVDWTDNYGCYYGEMALANATIYEVTNNHKVDVKSIYDNLELLKELVVRLKTEEVEKKEFERLKEKYG